MVEVDKYIVHVAKEAFCFPEKQQINIIQEDVFSWITSAKESMYDIVYIDIFEGKLMPKKAKDNMFFKEVARILKPNGLATSNVLFRDTEYLEKLSSHFKSCSIFKKRYFTCIK